jgi:curved DNA-binding protein CbpA
MNHIGLYLKEIHLKKKTGHLTFASGEIEKELFFQDGGLIFAKTNRLEERLGHLLFKMGKISGEAYSSLDQLILPRKKIGELLIQKGLISTRDLREGLILQMKEITLNAFPFFEAEMRFKERERYFEESYEPKLSIPSLLAEGIKRMPYHPALLSFLEKKIAQVQTNEQIKLLTEDEKSLFLQVDGRTASASLFSRLGTDAEFFWKTLYLLFCLDLIQFPPQETDVLMERDVSGRAAGDREARIADVAEFHKNLQSMNYYQILNVSRQASGEEIKQAYFRLARKYHPDSFGRDIEVALRGQVDEVFDAVTKAYRILSRKEERTVYDARIAAPSPDESQDGAKRADVLCRQAKTLFRQERFSEALILLEEAVRLQPNQSDYHLLLALVEYRTPSLRRKAEKSFLKAIELGPWNVESYMGLGLLYKKEGLLIKARKQFEKILEIDPDHKAARRELGLAEKEKGKKGLKDLLSGDIFGKKKKS